MSGIARVLAQRGERVTGCDRADSPLLTALRAEGIACAVGHGPDHCDDADRLVVSGAIPADAPELVRAREHGLPIRHRSEELAEILAAHDRRVVVAGAHGKTTTTSMLAFAAMELGLDPTFVVGGEVRDLGTNARGGASGLAIVEGDESDGSVARLPADLAVVLNVDLDHLDHYASIAEVVGLFSAWSARLPATGLLIVGDDIPLASPARIARFGLGTGEGLRALDARAIAGGVAFRPSRGPAEVRLAVPGIHNAGNACAAALVLEELGIALDDGFAVLARFRGAGRRYEVLGTRDGVTVVDDYAHHPAELTAALAAARSQATGRLIVLFQPHMPWRTRQFAAEFAAALLQADQVVLLETYLARGAPDADASAQRIADRIVAADGPPVELALDGAAAADRLRAITRSGDLLICCGAGPVDAVARAVLA